MMKKKILIPTDFSKNAWNAITYSAELFRDLECTFYLLNTYGAVGYSIGDTLVPEPGVKAYESAKTASEDGMEKVASMMDFRKVNTKHKYEMLSKFGDLLGVMKWMVEKKDIDLVVMGTKGASNRRGVLFGSNTTLVMEKLRNCPTLGVPSDVRVSSLNEIVFPTSYKTHYKRKELQYLVDIAVHHNATICVLHANVRDEISQSQKENQQLLTACLEDAKTSFHHVHTANPVQAVRIFVESRDSDMIALINKKHAFFGSVFSSPPMVKELGMFSKVPLLVLHDLRN